MITAGSPGSPTPAAFICGESMCISHQIEGIESVRCGSLASSGLPVADFVPSTAQLLLAARAPKPDKLRRLPQVLEKLRPDSLRLRPRRHDDRRAARIARLQLRHQLRAEALDRP